MKAHVSSNNKFIEKYRSRMIKTMCQCNPDWDKHDVEKIVDKMIKENVMNPRV